MILQRVLLDRAVRLLGERTHDHDERCEAWVLRQALRVTVVDLLQHNGSLEQTEHGLCFIVQEPSG